jgi:hypothetical protein
MKKLSRLASIALLTGLLSATAAEARTRVYVRIGPPAAVVETRTVAPGPGYVWVPGYQQWNGTSYVWTRGSWQTPPRHHAHWVTGRWTHSRHGYYWTEGRWR